MLMTVVWDILLFTRARTHTQYVHTSYTTTVVHDVMRTRGEKRGRVNKNVLRKRPDGYLRAVVETSMTRLLIEAQ